jgi:hypothetical protein
MRKKVAQEHRNNRFEDVQVLSRGMEKLMCDEEKRKFLSSRAPEVVERCSLILLIKSADVKRWVLRHVGARPRDRDAVDLRIINDVKKGTGRIIDSQNDVGGWPSLTENVRGSGDIPELDIPSKPNKIQPSGYTKLEEWLHKLARQVEN